MVPAFARGHFDRTNDTTTVLGPVSSSYTRYPARGLFPLQAHPANDDRDAAAGCRLPAQRWVAGRARGRLMENHQTLAVPRQAVTRLAVFKIDPPGKAKPQTLETQPNAGASCVSN